jgi:signal transduction histidine kinase
MKYITFFCFLVIPFLLFSQNQSSIDSILKSTQNIEEQKSLLLDYLNNSADKKISTNTAVAKKLIELSESTSDYKSQAAGNKILGKIYYKQARYNLSIDKHNKAYELHEKTGDSTSMGKDLGNLGASYLMLGMYPEAIDHLTNALRIFESLPDCEQFKAKILQNIGVVYWKWGRNDEAINFYKKALKQEQKIKDSTGIAELYQNIGIAYTEKANYSKALDYLNRSKDIFEKKGDLTSLAISLNNIGSIYEDQKDYKKCLQFYKKGLKAFNQLEYNNGIVAGNLNVGSCYLNMGQYDKAEQYFQKSLGLSLKLDLREYISKIYANLAILNQKKNNYEKAYNYQKKYTELNDSIFNKSTLRQFEELKKEYDSIQNSKQLASLKAQQKIQEYKIKKSRTIIYILVAVGGLVVVLLVFLFRTYKRKIKINNKLRSEVIKHKETSNELKYIKENLEKTIDQRTRDLKKINKKLEEEVDNQKRIKEDLVKAKNKAEESDRLKTNFLANMSHEVRTPLNAIVGFSQLQTSRDVTDEERNEYLRHIKDSTDNLTHLIDDIIDFAKIESGGIKIVKKECDPDKILKELWKKYDAKKVTTGKAFLDVKYKRPNKKHFNLKTDPDRLRQVLDHLLDNALKFTEKGYISFGYVYQDREVQFYVKDTGIGLKDDNQQVIFERFRQVDDGPTRKYGGTGLGLSISKYIIELLDGSIWVESEIGKGSTFHFKIPFEKVPAKKEKIDINKIDWSDKVILIAEDKEINFEIVKETLSDTNAKIIWARNGAEAVDYVKKEKRIDLILMDIQMPVLDGYQATEKIKDINDNIPVIAQTAYAMPEDSEKCIAVGCCDYIAKPIALEEFINKIYHFID